MLSGKPKPTKNPNSTIYSTGVYDTFIFAIPVSGPVINACCKQFTG